MLVLACFNIEDLASDDEKIWKTSLENYVEWLQRVFLHSPKSPVILIGTHLDTNDKGFFLNLFARPQPVLQKVSQRLRSRLESLPFFDVLILPESTPYDTPNTKICFIPVNNTLDLRGVRAWRFLTDDRRTAKSIRL